MVLRVNGLAVNAGLRHNRAMAKPSTLNARDNAHFAAFSDDWWDEGGDLFTLHQLNPVRLSALRTAVLAHFGGKPNDLNWLKGKAVLDLGCGGGVLAEPMAHLGGTVTGIDVGKESIAAAKRHAKAGGLDITYKVSTAEAEAKGKARYDIVVASEVIEHVENPALFIASAAKLLKPGGLFFLTTLNRTPQSFALAIVGAEYLLGIIPRGTHNWQKFLKPSEVSALLRENGLTLGGISGARFNPLSRQLSAHPTDTSVNYLLWATKPKR